MWVDNPGRIPLVALSAATMNEIADTLGLDGRLAG